jgi:hypothetical protein
MSFQLFVIPPSTADTAAAAAALTAANKMLARSHGDRQTRIPSGVLAVFYERLVVKHRDFSPHTIKEELDKSPWPEPILGPWDDHNCLSVGWPQVPEVPRFVVELAQTLGVSVIE